MKIHESCQHLSGKHPCWPAEPSLASNEVGGEREPRVLSLGSLLKEGNIVTEKEETLLSVERGRSFYPVLLGS